MRLSKRGQAAAGAATLLAIIVGLIIFFIVVIPPHERAKILGEDMPAGTNETTIREDLSELLLTSPGRIDLVQQQEIEHAIPAVTIYAEPVSTEIERIDSLHVEQSVVSGTQANVTFTLEEFSHTENALVSFNVIESSGRLQIQLNGQEIFNREVEQGNVRPIELSRSVLRRQNTLTFSVSSPGAALWAKNEYDLEGITVVADIMSVAAQQSAQTFIVSETEYNNIENVRLEFLPQCDVETAGPITVAVNTNQIYHGIPDCNAHRIPIEFSTDMMRSGENTVTFSVEQGEYYLSHIIVKSELERIDFPTYYFELSNEQYENVTAGDQDVMLNMDFVDIVTSKEGVLLINGRQVGFDTREISYEADISTKVVDGNNAIKIKPHKTLEIRELHVWLE